MNSGAYQLYIIVSKDIEINVGALGLCKFPKGKYIYTGSAMNNLHQRIARHLRSEKKIRWHIDYLLTSENVFIEKIKKFESDKKIECELNLKILIPEKTSIPVPGFGSSDCNNCPAHLIRIL